MYLGMTLEPGSAPAPKKPATYRPPVNYLLPTAQPMAARPMDSQPQVQPPAAPRRLRVPSMFAWCTDGATLASVVVVFFFVCLLIGASKYSANAERAQKAQPHEAAQTLQWIPSR